jgi:hypothetical protein
MFPDFFVIGAQKAGSTFLLQCLGEHPQIFMPPSEVPFFEDSFYLVDEMDRFERKFVGAEPGQVVGVKRPNILGHPECPERLARYMPNLKLIAILRHPVERAVSGYFHYMASGMIPIAPVEMGLRRILDGDYQGYPRAAEIVEFGFYGKHLRRFEQVFPRDRFHVTLFDDIKQDARAVLGQIFQFLQVDPAFAPKSIRNRPMAASYSLTRIRLTTALARYYRTWTPDGKYSRNRRGLVATPLRLLNISLDRNIWSRLFQARRPALSEPLAAELAEIYAADIADLEAWLGRPLAAWKQP